MKKPYTLENYGLDTKKDDFKKRESLLPQTDFQGFKLGFQKESHLSKSIFQVTFRLCMVENSGQNLGPIQDNHEVHEIPEDENDDDENSGNLSPKTLSKAEISGTTQLSSDQNPGWLMLSPLCHPLRILGRIYQGLFIRGGIGGYP